MMFHFLIQLFFSYFATVGFGLVINVPRRALNGAGISGALGWIVYWLAIQWGMNPIPANFWGALVVGVTGMFLASFKKIPSSIFNIPALVPLVPGASAYQALILILSGKVVAANQKLFTVILVAGAIAMGYVVSQLISEQYFRYRRRHWAD